MGRRERSVEEFFEDLASDASFLLLPVTYEVAWEILFVAPLRDPADRVIAATARVRRRRLVTSDQRIIQSGLAPVIE